ncbi:MAG: beta-ketoacyl-[acyl-carrier-protein] synthase family protein [Planctomycetota bacterium]|nr:beta-ketoacyl-[acyl-carrier-protein] synthase family protein [Planctomycetota bacterium]
MGKRRVGITGLGVVTAAGVGIEPTFQSIQAGRQCVGEIGLFDASAFPCGIGGELADFSARKFVPKSYRKSVKVMARDIEIAVVAAELAFRDAGIATRGTDDGEMSIAPKRLGCNIGAGLICTDLDELGSAVNTAVNDGKFDLKLWGSSGMNNLTPLWLLKYLPNMLACHVTIIHGCEGPSNCITCGGAAGHLSIGEGARWITRDAADVVIAGGAESKINPMGLMRQTLLGRVCTGRNDRPADACRPFDADHTGTVAGEGGGLVILEELTCAESRRAKIYAELVGFGAACDPAGFDVMQRSAGSLDLAARKAIAEAGISPQDIDLIVAHGTAVPGEDVCEAAAWRAVLGESGSDVPVVATTGAIGSLFAGAGGVELAVAAMAVSQQSVPQTVNFAKVADGCAPLAVSSETRDAELKYVLTGAFSVGGQSAACVLKRIES